MESEEVQRYFTGKLSDDEGTSAGIAAIRTLMEFIKTSESETVTGLKEDLKHAVAAMRNTNYSVAAINSGTELFLRHITLAKLDDKDDTDFKEKMLTRGQWYLTNLGKAIPKISKRASQYIMNGSAILTHSRSRVVLETFLEAAKEKKHFHVYITRSACDDSGEKMYSALQKLNSDCIKCTLILDSAVGYVMEKVDFIMVGAEAVVESGGIINKLGCYTMALCAREMNKPFYVLTESFKFSRLFPLSSGDISDDYKYTAKMRKQDTSKLDPLVDYTSPKYITLLFTDLGILTPSAVSDVLINLYL